MLESPVMSRASPSLLERVLILAPTAGDAVLTAELLMDNELEAQTVRDCDTLCREIDRGVGAVIVTSEALDPAAIEAITTSLKRQPKWSEIPILVFTGLGEGSDGPAKTYDILGERAHVTLVDRPIRVRTLISGTRSALRSRRRQYEISELLQDLQRHVDRLSGLADASLAIASAGSLQDVLAMLTDQARRLLASDVAVTRVATDFERGQSISVASSSDRYEPWTAELTRTDEIDLQEVVGKITDAVRLHGEETTASEMLGMLFGDQGAVQYPLRGLVAAPLVEHDKTNIGYIAVSNKTGGEFSTDDESVLVQLAQMASAVVQKARLYREAEEASRAKDDFLATLAHELRTPMTSILGWVQMLKAEDGENRADIDTAIQMIESSTRIQATLVEDLLDVSRIIAGKLKIAAEPTELGPLVENVAATFENVCADKNIALHAQIEPSPLSMWGDPTRLQQIIWNLLSNAIKFTSSGGSIWLTLRREGDSALISVRDTGEGIAPEFLPHVFERFKQAERGTRREHSGLGLGLAIVRHLVEAHGGSVGVRSEGLGTGAEFEVRVPLTVVRVMPDDADSILPTLRGRKLLVVDDDESARTLLGKTLENFGAQVRTAGSVRDALKTLISFDAELVISDLHMPGEDGYALIGRLQDLQSRFGREIPAVALTGYGRPEDRVRALGSGFRHYVQKPVELRSLARIAADLVERQ